MVDFGDLEAWFVSGSQHLYAADALKTVEEHANSICFNRSVISPT
jgi:L-arabinose isomerase